MEKQSRYQEIVEGLSRAIYQLTWLGHFWGWRGAIILDEIRSWYIAHKLDDDKIKTLSQRSSTYYAAAGNAKARASRTFIAKPFWLIVGAFCFFRALRLSNRFEKEQGLHNLTANELDVRQSILRKAGRRRDALERIEMTLARNDISIKTRVFLEIGKGEILEWEGKIQEASAIYTHVWMLVNEFKDDPTTAVRICKAVAGYFLRHADGRWIEAFEQGLRIAEENQLTDQIEKLNALKKA